MEVVGRARLELRHEVQVEVQGLGRLHVNEQPAAADVIGQGHEAQKSVPEEGATEAPSLVRGVDANRASSATGWG